LYLFLGAFIVVTLGLVVLQQSSSSLASMEVISGSSNQSILSDNGTSTTISPIGTGITSLTATAINNSWLSFDGVNDYAYLPYNYTISLWFKNDTSDWTQLINSSGTIDSTYINGILNDTWTYFPFYSNGTDWILGKSDGSTFEEVKIDQIEIYDEWINSTKSMDIYNEGR